MTSAFTKSESSGHPALFLMTNTLETGGSERQFATLARSLSVPGLELMLGCLRKQGPFAEGLKNIVEFPPQGSLFNLKSQRARMALGRHLRANRVLVAHSFDFYSNFMLIPSARLAGIPVVVGSQRQLGDLLSSFRNTAQHALFRWCDRIVCNSRAAAKGLERAGIRSSKLVVIPNVLTTEALAETAPAIPRIPGRVRVVMIARMNDPAKRHDVFLAAAARVAAKHLQLDYVLVGDGPLRAGLERMAAELGLQSRISFLGDRRDVPAVLASSDISVLSSDSESLSNAIMESMAAGLPVLACRVGGNEELVRDGENGFLVPAGDHEALADCVGRLAQDAELRAAFGAASKKYAQNFTVERVCAEYERLYLSLLEEKGIERQALVHPVA